MKTVYTAALSGHGLGDIFGQMSFDILADKIDEPFFWRVSLTREWSPWFNAELFQLLWRAGLFTRVLVSIDDDWQDCLRRTYGIDADIKDFLDCERLAKIRSDNDVSSELRERFSFLPVHRDGFVDGQVYSTLHLSSSRFANDKHLTREDLERYFLPSATCLIVGSRPNAEITEWLRGRYRTTRFIECFDTTLAEYLGVLKNSSRHLSTASGSGIWTAQFGIPTTMIFSGGSLEVLDGYRNYYQGLKWFRMAEPA